LDRDRGRVCLSLSSGGFRLQVVDLIAIRLLLVCDTATNTHHTCRAFCIEARLLLILTVLQVAAMLGLDQGLHASKAVAES
jgi:hypothetical protein